MFLFCLDARILQYCRCLLRKSHVELFITSFRLHSISHFSFFFFLPHIFPFWFHRFSTLGGLFRPFFFPSSFSFFPLQTSLVGYMTSLVSKSEGENDYPVKIKKKIPFHLNSFQTHSNLIILGCSLPAKEWLFLFYFMSA